MPTRRRKQGKTSKGDGSNVDTSSGRSSNDSTESVFHLLFARNHDWTKTEFEDAIYWIRQIMSIVFGIMFGLIPLRGFVGIGSYWAMSVLLIDYYKGYLKVSDEVMDRFDAWKEGAMPAFAMFMVAWVTTYSAAQF